MAYVGQFQNTIAIFTMLSTCAISSGVIRYLASYHEDRQKQQQVITTAFSIVLCFSFLVSLFVISFSGILSKSVFHSGDFWQVYLLYGLFVIIIALNILFSAVLNGLKQIKNLTIVNISGSLASIGLTVGFAYGWGVTGVLIASNFVALLIFLVNIFYIRKLENISWRPSFKKWDRPMARKLFAFTLMGIVSGFAAPIMQLVVRDRLISKFNDVDAGCWQAVTRISDYYLLFIITVLSVYYLPRLSEINNKKDLRSEIVKGYKIILPAVASLALIIWLCKVWVVHILFTAEFLPMLPLFKFQLLGDFFKIGSWLLGFIMISKALTKMFIITEILFSTSFVVLSYIFISHFGVIGTTYAFCLNYALYWVTMWVLMKKYII